MAVTKKGSLKCQKTAGSFKKGFDPRRNLTPPGRPKGHLSPVTVMKNLLNEAAADGKTKLETICRDMVEDKPELAVKMAYGDIFGRGYVEKDVDDTEAQWRSLLDVSRAIFGDGYKLTRFHRWLLSKFNAFVTDYHMGLAPRLHISLPPQHGKSEGVRLACAFALEMCKCRCAWASYNVSFAKKSSRAIREWFEEHRKESFGKDDKKTEAEWVLSTGGSFLATGVGGQLTGETVDIMFIDDLIKNYEEYCSNARRNKLRHWLKTVVNSRVRNTTAMLSIGTRWGQDDAIDMLTTEIGGSWQIYSIPAIPGYNVDTGEIADKLDTPDPIGRAPGVVLWPEEHSVELLKDKMQKAGPLVAASMYQQAPKQVTGNFFRRDKWGKAGPDMAAELRSVMCRYWDLGFVEDGHLTAGALGYVGIITRANGEKECSPFVVKDILSFSEQWPVTKQRILRQANVDGTGVVIGIEANGTQISNFLEIANELRPRGFTVIPRKSKPDKESDARAWQSLQWGGLVLLGNTGTLIDKADRFPQSDIDEVDAISGLFWVSKLNSQKVTGGYLT